MTKSLAIRLHAYAPNGASLGFLPAPLSLDASFEHDDAGTLSVSYSRKALGGAILSRGLESGLEVGLEASDGGAWVEPYNARFLLTGRSRDATDRSDTVKLTLMTYVWLTKKILNLNLAALRTDGDNKGKRAFLSSNPGTIVSTFLTENRARGGAATCLTTGFDTRRDTHGDAWQRVMTLYYDAGVDLYTVISNLTANGVCDWRTQERQLLMFNADSTGLVRDLSDTVRIATPSDVLEAPEEESIEDLASNILIAGDNLTFTQSNPSAPSPWGKWELYCSQGGVSDESTARLLMQSQLDQAARVRGQYTRGVLVDGVDMLPLIDYRPGDWITAPTVSHGERVRVQRVSLSLSSSGLKCALILNDRMYDAQTRQARRVNGITGGAVAGGAQGGRPAPENDHRTPSAPQGLVVDTSAYLDSTGYARGLASLEWAQVTAATDGTGIDIASYRVDYRKNVAGAPWMAGGSTEASKTSLGIGNLECGVTYEFRVRAIPTYSHSSGDWSSVVVALVASDVTPPSVPSAPIASSDLAVVKLHWDGLTASGAHMERDFDHLDVAQGTGANDLKVIMANAVGTGDYLITGLTVGSKPVFAFRSVDHSGNASDWSVTAQVTVDSAVRPADIKALDNDIASNKTAIGDANKQITQNTTDITTANGKLSTAQSDIAKAKSDITSNASAITQARTDITNAAGKAQTALDKANSVSTSVDGLHNVYQGPDDPTTLSGATVRIGDTWRRTQRYWTRWQGDSDNSASLLADFYTYWQGEPNNSPSVLVTLDSRVVDVSTWDGLRWNAIDLIARNILATGTITGDLIAANTIRGNSIIAGSISTDRLAALSITTPLLAALAVTVDKLAANSVSTDKLTANSVTGAKIAALSIDASKIVAGSITGDRLAANTITAREIKSRSITSDNIMAGQFKGYVFTGAVFQSSTAANTGIKISSTALQMWDSSHNQTVYLDGEGKNNVLTGNFQTATTGDRIMISAQATATIIGGSTSLSGQSIVFKNNDFATSPSISGYFTNSDVGYAPEITLYSGYKAAHDPAAVFYLQSLPRSQGATGSGITSRALISANTDYSEPDSTKKSFATLDLKGIGGSGAYASLEAHAYSGNKSEVWVTASRNDGVSSVGICADAFTQRIYIGGKLGGLTNQQTFQADNWEIISGHMGAGSTFGPATVALSPAKYGVYHAVANADVGWGSIFIHVLNTGSASQYQVIGYNAGGAFDGDIWVDAIAWLT